MELKFIYQMDRELLLKAKQLTIESQNSEIDTVIDMDKAIREAFVKLLDILPSRDQIRGECFHSDDHDTQPGKFWYELNQLLK